MSASNDTLTDLWVEGASGSPIRIVTTPTRTPSTVATNSAIGDDFIKICKEAGLESVAKEGGVLDANGSLATATTTQEQNKTVQMIAVPVPGSNPRKFKLEPGTMIQAASPQIVRQIKSLAQIQTSSSTSPQFVRQIISTPQRQQTLYRQVVTPSPRQVATTPTIAISSPQQQQQQNSWQTPQGIIHKRPHELETEIADSYVKRMKKGEKAGKGLRHFSMKVCEKVQKKGVTSYNEVADELVSEFSDPRTISPTDQQYDQKNIRRRVYDALNVLMAMNIISKEKKEIRWIGLPTNSAQECHNMELEKQKRIERIKLKQQHLQELILQQIAFKNLVQRNKQKEQESGAPVANSAIQLPFIIVNTNKKTVIDCRISNDKYEYLFKFDNTFEIHDDIEVLKRMGMAFGLEKGVCTPADLNKALKMVPQALQPYVHEMTNSQKGSLATLLGVPMSLSSDQGIPGTSLPSTSTQEQTADAEVAAIAQGSATLSRQSSLGSASETFHSRETPSEPYSEDSDNERNSPFVEVS